MPTKKPCTTCGWPVAPGEVCEVDGLLAPTDGGFVTDAAALEADPDAPSLKPDDGGASYSPSKA